ncbi:hypothetical protein BH20CHL2_BH20CHL2_12790 [soil metagenome]
MGSRPPRKQPLPKRTRQPRLATPDTGSPSTGLSMETITPIIAFLTFPVAAGAAFVGYIASASSTVIGVAAIITVVTFISIWAVLRTQARLRRRLHPTNELLAAIIIAIIGLMLALGGIASVTLVWIIAGLVVLGGAFLIVRPSLRAAHS